MSTIDTFKWIGSYSKECENNRLRDGFFIQVEHIAEKVATHYPDILPEEILYHLHMNGLIQPREWKTAREVVNGMKVKGIWEKVDGELEHLRTKWKGPNVPVYIFPISGGHQQAGKRKMKKNGLAIKEAIFLFLSDDHDDTELKAILAHEYHHVCRMNALQLDDQNLTLKELLVLEGAAEWAVKELYGTKWMAPWTSKHTRDEAKRFWEKTIKQQLDSDHQQQNMRLMYGRKGLPEWMGYSVAFHLVAGYAEKHPITSKRLCKIKADEILKESSFPV